MLALLGLPIANPTRYPADAPLLADCLPQRFLRHARALPVAFDDETVALGHRRSARPVHARRRRRRHRPARRAGSRGADRAGGRAGPPVSRRRSSRERRGRLPTPPLEDDAERLKDLASEAPVIRLVNQIITRAVETHASDIHIEPFEDRLRVRYRYDGVLHEADSPPLRLAAGDHLAHQDHGAARHRRAAAAAGRPHQAGGARPGGRFPRLHHRRRCMARPWCCASSTAPPWRSITPSWGCRRR